MSLFVLDAAGDKDLLKFKSHGDATTSNTTQWRPLDENVRKSLVVATKDAECEPEDFGSDNDDDEDYFGMLPPSQVITHIIRGEYKEPQEKKTQLEQDLDLITKIINNVLKRDPKEHRNKNRTDYDALSGKFVDEDDLNTTDVAKELEKSRLVPDLGRLKELPDITKKKQRILNRIERSKTKGPGWYNLPATEQTEETKNELKILQMRSVLDPKHFYKKNDLKVLPKYFQIGTVQHSPLDYYNERGTRHKKRSLVDDLLQDEVAQSYTKRKFKEVAARREKYAHRKAMQKMKKLKKNK